MDCRARTLWACPRPRLRSASGVRLESGTTGSQTGTTRQKPNSAAPASRRSASPHPPFNVAPDGRMPPGRVPLPNSVTGWVLRSRTIRGPVRRSRYRTSASSLATCSSSDGRRTPEATAESTRQFAPLPARRFRRLCCPINRPTCPCCVAHYRRRHGGYRRRARQFPRPSGVRERRHPSLRMVFHHLVEAPLLQVLVEQQVAAVHHHAGRHARGLEPVHQVMIVVASCFKSQHFV